MQTDLSPEFIRINEMRCDWEDKINSTMFCGGVFHTRLNLLENSLEEGLNT